MNRVIINEHGEAIPPKFALRDHGITPDWIFIRADGWSLGAPDKFYEVARKMWAWEAIKRIND